PGAERRRPAAARGGGHRSGTGRSSRTGRSTAGKPRTRRTWRTRRRTRRTAELADPCVVTLATAVLAATGGGRRADTRRTGDVVDTARGAAHRRRVGRADVAAAGQAERCRAEARRGVVHLGHRLGVGGEV